MHVQLGNVIIVGTSHVSATSVKEITSLCNKYPISLIAVELDAHRLQKLLTNDEKQASFFSLVRTLGFRAATFSVFASYAQKKIGKMVNLDPGSEMKHAALLAKKKNIPLVCIDQHISNTLRKLNGAFNFSFFFSMFKDMINGLFFPKRLQKELGIKTLSLQEVPPQDVIDKLILMMKRQYPRLYNVLVHERNIVMANAIIHLQRKHDGMILVVVGAGHVSGIVELLSMPSINIHETHFDDAQLSYSKTTTKDI